MCQYFCPCCSRFLAVAGVQIAHKAVGRGILLIVCTGLSVVRRNLPLSWWMLLSAAIGGFFALGMVEKIVQFSADVSSSSPSFWSYVIALANGIFVVLVYGALSNTRDRLKERRQHFKLKMYTKLGYILASFLFLYIASSLLTVLRMYDAVKVRHTSLFCVATS